MTKEKEKSNQLHLATTKNNSNPRGMDEWMLIEGKRKGEGKGTKAKRDTS